MFGVGGVGSQIFAWCPSVQAGCIKRKYLDEWSAYSEYCPRGGGPLGTAYGEGQIILAREPGGGGGRGGNACWLLASKSRAFPSCLIDHLCRTEGKRRPR